VKYDKNKYKIVLKNADDLISAEYNPRQLTKDQYKNLRDSIKRFGLVDPIIINSNKERVNIIIGGHQRVKIAKDLKITEIPCIELNLDYEKERELNVRLNKNTGEWNFDELANNFDFDELIEIGFTESELKIDHKEEEIEPEIEISPEIFERHDYLVFYFDNEFDWNVANELFDLKTVKNSNAKLVSKGLGRVLKGKDLLKLLDDE
tara:strand:- start:11350 stop:11967 length:618 start_codon:yes stop_codon:yes gene_type:complete